MYFGRCYGPPSCCTCPISCKWVRTAAPGSSWAPRRPAQSSRTTRPARSRSSWRRRSGVESAFQKQVDKLRCTASLIALRCEILIPECTFAIVRQELNLLASSEWRSTYGPVALLNNFWCKCGLDTEAFPVSALPLGLLWSRNVGRSAVATGRPGIVVLGPPSATGGRRRRRVPTTRNRERQRFIRKGERGKPIWKSHKILQLI